MSLLFKKFFFIIFITLLLSSSLWESDTSEIEPHQNNRTDLEYSDIKKFYKSNPLDAFYLAFFKEIAITYKTQMGIPVKIDAEIINWDKESYIFLEMTDNKTIQLQWKDLLPVLTNKSYVHQKRSTQILLIGTFQKNEYMNNRLDFFYIDELSREIISLPIVSDNFTLSENKPVIIEGTITDGVISPGNKNPKIISILEMMYL